MEWVYSKSEPGLLSQFKKTGEHLECNRGSFPRSSKGGEITERNILEMVKSEYRLCLSVIYLYYWPISWFCEKRTKVNLKGCPGSYKVNAEIFGVI